VDNKAKLIIGGAAALLLLILGFLFWPRGEGNDLRANLLALANRYYEDGEYQRALDKLDELLIQDPEDEEANESPLLRVVQARRDEEESRKRQEELEAMRTGQEGLEGQLSQLNQNLRDNQNTSCGHQRPGCRPGRPNA
jgi:tetratricopeptide (TPR) repeat protein